MNDESTEHVRRYYAEQSLDESRLARILEDAAQQQVAADHIPDQPLTRRRQRSTRNVWQKISVAVASIFLLAGSLVFWQHHHVNNELQVVTLREAAMNHVKQFKMDVYGDNVSQLTEQMAKLPFPLKVSQQFSDMTREFGEVTLLGGRYCTIAGNLAVHLTFQLPDSSDVISLFMTNTTEPLTRMAGASAHVRGVSVSLWEERDLFYALAHVGS